MVWNIDNFDIYPKYLSIIYEGSYLLGTLYIAQCKKRKV